MHNYEVIEHGCGTPLVLLHGLMGRPGNWQGLFAHLPGSCRAIALGLPFFTDGHCLDGVPAVVDYVRGYLDEMGFSRVVLCGNSLGGHVSLVLAIREPARVAGVVLTGSSGLFERTFNAPPSRQPSREWIEEKVREIFYDPSLATSEMIDEVCRVLTLRHNKRDFVRIAKSAKQDNMCDRLAGVTCPTLLVWGRQDAITPPDVAEEFKSLIPGSELAWLEKCGHAAMIERPREFAAAISSWWERRIDSTAGAAKADIPSG